MRSETRREAFLTALAAARGFDLPPLHVSAQANVYQAGKRIVDRIPLDGSGPTAEQVLRIRQAFNYCRGMPA